MVAPISEDMRNWSHKGGGDTDDGGTAGLTYVNPQRFGSDQ